MRTILPLLVTMYIGFQTLHAQNYVPFNLDSTKWVMTEILPILGPGDGSENWEIYTTHDTVINSKTYKIIALRNLCVIEPDRSTGHPIYFPADETEFGDIGGLREDSMRVYFYKFKNLEHFVPRQGGLRQLTENTEFLLYDFTLNVGDTTFYPGGVFSVVIDVQVIDGVRTLIVNNSTSFQFLEEHEIKQGVGSSTGILGPFYGFLASVSCYFPNLTRDRDCGLCPRITTSTHTIADPEKIKLFPNPNTGSFAISSDHPIHSLQITDLSGRVIRQMDGLNSRELTIDTPLDAGVYLARVEQDQVFRYTKFLVIP